jgi:BASS family bile acid:Na+ symporter
LVFLGEKIPGASMVLGKIHLDQGKILEGVFIILGLPMCLGMLTTKFFPVFSSKLHKVMGKISFLFLLMFIAGALAANYQHFISHIEIILKISFLTNILVLLTGFLCAKAFALNGQDTRAVVFCDGNTKCSIRFGIGLPILRRYGWNGHHCGLVGSESD